LTRIYTNGRLQNFLKEFYNVTSENLETDSEMIRQKFAQFAKSNSNKHLKIKFVKEEVPGKLDLPERLNQSDLSPRSAAMKAVIEKNLKKLDYEFEKDDFEKRELNLHTSFEYLI